MKNTHGCEIITFRIQGRLEQPQKLLHIKSFLNDFIFGIDLVQRLQNQGSLIIEAEGDNPNDLSLKLKDKTKKITNFFDIVFGMKFQIKSTRQMLNITKDQYLVKFDSLLNTVNPEKFENYLKKSLSENELLLKEALDNYEKDQVFEAFPKLVNWLEDNQKIQTKFCPVRNCLSHKTVETRKKVEQNFPGEFEFDEDNIFKRSSEKNVKSLKKYLPQLVHEARKEYLKIINSG